MRKDMSKVLVERERKGGGYSKHTRSRQKSVFRKDPESAHAFESTARRRKTEYKQLNENLSPLLRYIRSKVGQKWNDIYSEICEHVKLDNTVQKHIIDHLFGYVELNCIEKNGKVYSSNNEELSRYSESFYVNQDGILKHIPRKPRRRNKVSPEYNYPTKEKLVGYVKINDAWFELRFAYLKTLLKRFIDGFNEYAKISKEHYLSTMAKDHFTGDYLDVQCTVEENKMFGNARYIRVLGDFYDKDSMYRKQPYPIYLGSSFNANRIDNDKRYCISKRALSKKEIKKLGLK